jgi:phage shock protein PspC (stress-responsive transcriptional regulator)
MEQMTDTTARTSLDKDRLDGDRLDGDQAASLPGAGALPPFSPEAGSSGSPAGEPAAGPAPAGPGFRIRRSRTDRMLGGVCGGLAESLGVDATLLRIGLVALTVLGAGFGVVLYAAIWLLAPETDAA